LKKSVVRHIGRGIGRDMVFVLGAMVHIPHLLLFYVSPHLIRQDMARYRQDNSSSVWLFLRLLIFVSEFRALFYYRIGLLRFLVQWIHPVRLNLYLLTPNIGGGLRLQHGFCTVVAAKKVGKNCWINQQVTIGYTNNFDAPVIGDNVTVNAGAIIIGNVSIGDNSIIGAGSVVTKDVPPNCTVVGNPAYIVRKDGVKTREVLIGRC
jgi:serine O-acetyltransferase